MKRSEMLQELCDAILASGITTNFCIHKDDLSNIFQKLEDAGMLPPDYNANQGNGRGIPSYMVNEWELE